MMVSSCWMKSPPPKPRKMMASSCWMITLPKHKRVPKLMNQLPTTSPLRMTLPPRAKPFTTPMTMERSFRKREKPIMIPTQQPPPLSTAKLRQKQRLLPRKVGRILWPPKKYAKTSNILPPRITPNPEGAWSIIAKASTGHASINPAILRAGKTTFGSCKKTSLPNAP